MKNNTKDCTKCKYFYDAGEEYHCKRLLTHCKAVKAPDLGKRLRCCEYAPKEASKKGNAGTVEKKEA